MTDPVKPIYCVTKEIRFCYGHRLLNYSGKCRYLHGHNGRALITLYARHLDAVGMVCDFTEMKESIGKWIDENLDHRMILSKHDPILPYLEKLGEPMYVLDENPTAEAIARLIYREVARLGYPVVQVTLWETETSFATYAEPEQLPWSAVNPR